MNNIQEINNLEKIIRKLIKKEVKFDFPSTSVFLEGNTYEIDKILLNVIEEIDNMKFISISNDLKQKINIDEFVNAIDSAKTFHSIVFDKAYYLKIEEGKKISLLTNIFETFTYANIEKIWFLFAKPFITLEHKNLYQKYSHKNDYPENFGLYELHFLTNNINKIKISGNSLKDLWEFFTKKEVWSWFKDLRKIRNTSMHADFRKVDEEKKVLNEKYNNIICSISLFVYILYKIIKILNNSNVTEKFIINELYSTKSDDKEKVKQWYNEINNNRSNKNEIINSIILSCMYEKNRNFSRLEKEMNQLHNKINMLGMNEKWRRIKMDEFTSDLIYYFKFYQKQSDVVSFLQNTTLNELDDLLIFITNTKKDALHAKDYYYTIRQNKWFNYLDLIIENWKNSTK